MSIPKLKKHDNGYWYVHTVDGRRSKRESTGAKEVAAAKAYLAQFLLNSATESGPPEAVFTIAELWSVYDDRHVKKNVAAPDGLRFAWKNLEKHFGALSPAAISQELVDAYESERLAGTIGRKSNRSTVRKELGALRACLNWCAAPSRKILRPEHVPAFDLPPDGEPRDRWLQMAEIQTILGAAAALRDGPRLSRAERFLWIALETAARKTAILELTWDRVDFETGVIHLNVPGRVVTKKRRADVPISKALRPVLERAYAERGNFDLVLDYDAEIWGAVQQVVWHSGLVGPAPKRKILPGGSYGRLPATGVSPHVLRHTAATHMARRGVPLWIIAKVLGNTLAMVEKVYAKHCPDDLREAVDRISGGVLEAAE